MIEIISRALVSEAEQLKGVGSKDSDGTTDGNVLGSYDIVGKELGRSDGETLGISEKCILGLIEGICEGKELGRYDGFVLGTSLGASVGVLDGARLGSNDG
jgi:hypothetical protein